MLKVTVLTWILWKQEDMTSQTKNNNIVKTALVPTGSYTSFFLHFLGWLCLIMFVFQQEILASMRKFELMMWFAFLGIFCIKYCTVTKYHRIKILSVLIC